MNLPPYLNVERCTRRGTHRKHLVQYPHNSTLSYRLQRTKWRVSRRTESIAVEDNRFVLERVARNDSRQIGRGELLGAIRPHHDHAFRGACLISRHHAEYTDRCVRYSIIVKLRRAILTNCRATCCRSLSDGKLRR